MARKRTKAAAASHGSRRASWTGNLAFGLVSFPVNAFNALNREQSDIHFHQLHAGCHRRIQYQKVCPVHGELSSDEIVSGYEFRKGKYVEITPEELDSVRTDKDRALVIDTFIDPTIVDPVYFDGRMYYLLPSTTAATEPYAVMVQAMSRENRYGIGNVVMFGKEQLAMVRAVEGVMHLIMLNFDEEIRPPRDVKQQLTATRPAARQVTLARTLIRNWFKQKFDFTQYDDEYRKRVERLIKNKVAGKDVVTPEEPEQETEVINLMDALKRSLQGDKAASARSGRKRQKKTSA